MTGATIRSTALIAVLATASWAGVDVEIRNGDKLVGTISPATEVEIVRFRAPRGAVISVKGAAARRGPQIRLQLKDPAGSPLLAAEGKSAAISRQKALVSGLYSVEVTSRDGASTGDYTLAVSWKSPTSFVERPTISAAGTQDVDFSADAGATATFSVKPAKRSPAAPTLASWTKPDLSVETLSGTSQKRTLSSTGDSMLTVASVAGGGVVATVKIKRPAASKRKYVLTSAVIGGGGASGDTAYSAILGPGGGAFAAPIVGPGLPGAQLDGVRVSVPAGALPVETAIVIATAPDIATTGAQTGAGATVAFGPEGLRFDAVDPTKSATVTVPFDASFAAVKDQVVILTRDAKGVVTPVAKPYTFDLVAETVSFEARHFSSFRAVGPTPAAQPAAFSTVAAVMDPQDICEAFDPDVNSTSPIQFFVAEGTETTVAAIRLPNGTTQFTRETWVGGGSQTTTPVNRTQFRFTDHVNTVYATPDGVLYVGTNALIFRVDPSTGTVDRIAGSGPLGDAGDQGPALQATFKSIRKIVVDGNGGIYVADDSARRIRYVDVNGSGNVVAWAGSGSSGIGADGGNIATTKFTGPTGLSFARSGGLYVADGGRIRHLDPLHSPAPVNVTVAGRANGAVGSTGDGGAPTAAKFYAIAGISPYVDPRHPSDDALLLVDSYDHTLRLVNLTGATVELVAGVHGTPGFSGDNGSTPGLLNGPNAVAAKLGFVFVSDKGNRRIRAISDP